MDLTKLEKAAKIFEKIRLLDAEIVGVDSFAMTVASGITNASLELKIETPAKVKKENILDGDGSLKIGTPEITQSSFKSFFAIMSPFYKEETVETNKNETVLKHTLTEKTTLQVLGTILLQKKEARESLIKRLEKLGVQI